MSSRSGGAREIAAEDEDGELDADVLDAGGGGTSLGGGGPWCGGGGGGGREP